MVKVTISCWTELDYEMWHQQNSKTFDDRLESVEIVARSTLLRVSYKTALENYSYFR